MPVKVMNTTHSLCSDLCCVVTNGQDSEEVSVSLCHDPFCIISSLRNGGDNVCRLIWSYMLPMHT